MLFTALYIVHPAFLLCTIMPNVITIQVFFYIPNYYFSSYDTRKEKDRQKKTVEKTSKNMSTDARKYPMYLAHMQ